MFSFKLMLIRIPGSHFVGRTRLIKTINPIDTEFITLIYYLIIFYLKIRHIQNILNKYYIRCPIKRIEKISRINCIQPLK